MNRLFRSFWRQIAMGVLIALPLFVLMVLGVFWLIHSEWFLPAFIAMALAGIVVAFLGHSVRKAAVNPNASIQSTDSAWAPAENDAWLVVQDIAKNAQSNPPLDLKEFQGLATDVVQKVAQHLHGASDVSWIRFTLPEILQATEQAAKELRESVRTRIPGAESVSIADVMVIYRLYVKHQTKGKVVWWAYRFSRFIAAPQIAVVQEAKSYASGKALDATFTVLQGWVARLFAEELGRAAINLYSGRYRLAATEAIEGINQSAPSAKGPVPIRILLAGQVNAGKSSLTNALLGCVKSPVSELPTPGGIREFRIDPNNELDLVVLDSPGLTALGENKQILIDSCREVDLVIWLAQANNPARAIDAQALSEIRDWFKANPKIKPPPMMLVMTHIDKISPAKEWAPPYDIVRGETAKASGIRKAMEQVGKTLGISDQTMIPVALRSNEEPYNLDALWSSIGCNLSDAQLTALDRELKKGRGFSTLKELKKLRDGGTFFLGKLWADRIG